MDSEYWDKVCGDYQGEILSVFDNDDTGVVERRIVEAGRCASLQTSADLGCGVGRFTPLLAENFEHVHASDVSEVGLRKAKSRCRKYRNVAFHQVDFENDAMPFEPVDFVFCVNVLIMPSLNARLKAWRSVVNQVVQGGQLLLVLPSLESVHLEFYAEIESRLDEGDGCGEAVRNAIDEQARAADLRLGIHQLDGVRTKHYLKEEILGRLDGEQFDVTSVDKVVYSESETTGFAPWDWLVVARRR